MLIYLVIYSFIYLFNYVRIFLNSFLFESCMFMFWILKYILYFNWLPKKYFSVINECNDKTLKQSKLYFHFQSWHMEIKYRVNQTYVADIRIPAKTTKIVERSVYSFRNMYFPETLFLLKIKCKQFIDRASSFNSQLK